MCELRNDFNHAFKLENGLNHVYILRTYGPGAWWRRKLLAECFSSVHYAPNTHIVFRLARLPQQCARNASYLIRKETHFVTQKSSSGAPSLIRPWMTKCAIIHWQGGQSDMKIKMLKARCVKKPYFMEKTYMYWSVHCSKIYFLIQTFGYL